MNIRVIDARSDGHTTDKSNELLGIGNANTQMEFLQVAGRAESPEGVSDVAEL